MASPRIVLSTYDDIHNPYYGGGGAISIHEVAKRLVRDYDMQVTVVTGMYPGARAETFDGVNYERHGWFIMGPKTTQLLYQLTLPWALLTRSFDLWIESFTPPFSTALLPLYTRRPVVGLAHLFGGEEMERKYRLPFRFFEQLGIRCYQSCIAVSERAADAIRSANPAVEVRVIENGVSHADLFSDQKEAAYILYLGRIETDQKGLDLLLEAYAKLTSSERLPLVMAGTGTPSEVAKVRRSICAYGLENAVELVGKVTSMTEKRELLRRAAVVIMPSRYETLPLVALEAIASGTPLLAFDIPGLDWIPGDLMRRVKAFDTAALAQELASLIAHPEERARLALAGSAWSRQYNWERVAKSYAAAVREWLG